ncbi:hypothetical protein TBLA_0H03820 [Henningerozyma blattae CBS 6284]|uniref:AB hydrolase-1 domain-containing protein n=1 Tax=Henningerozyma blattae (strain ATCC 34711 / CBS 6284 / DSM 70876 / NBRC 10599 / NRRL Y-10934 / UCD 77-7) TaxID=1071380 RepID=I2H8G1_HENB6|nr:hypothetical protein TBLA_0H03820 [Tetrapisispora blattae CBS 6284]CCH62663.1 hypothetical protein TBLA_0H03820 [Tetrapisispora blattae CBS 6284]
MEGSSSLPILNPFHWGFNGTVTHFASDETVELLLKEAHTKTDFHHFINQNIPGLRNGANFRLNPMLFTGILQTMYLSGANLTKKYQVFYGREVVNFSDGGICTADWVIDSWPEKYKFDKETGLFDKNKFIEDEKATHPDNWPRLHPRTRFVTKEEQKIISEDIRPLVLVIHGLAGGSHEPIIRSLTEQLSTIDHHKFQVVVLNSRGCARSKVSNRMLFTAFHTDDIKEFLQREHARNPKRKIYAVGFSFGATLLANYLGKTGDNSLISAAATVSNPWDMVASGEKMELDWWSRNLFSKAIAQFLTRTVEVNMGELGLPDGSEPDHEPTPDKPCFYMFTKENVTKAKSLTSTSQFDNTNCSMFGFLKNALAYYKAASSINNLQNIRVPTVIINSRDDPVVGLASIPYKQIQLNRYTVLCETDLGGHLAYLDSNQDSWVTKNIAQYFAKFDELVL